MSRWQVERFRSKSKGGSSRPLTYALVALCKLKPKTASHDADVQHAITSAVTLVRKELVSYWKRTLAGPSKRRWMSSSQQNPRTEPVAFTQEIRLLWCCTHCGSTRPWDPSPLDFLYLPHEGKPEIHLGGLYEIGRPS